MSRLLSEALKEDFDIKGEKAEFHITSTQTVELNDDGATWSKMPGMVLNPLSTGFTAADSTLTKVTNSGGYIVNGVSDLSVSAACTIYYAIFLNDSAVAHEITEHTFSNQAKTENISITALVSLDVDDYIEVYVKGDGTNNVTMTIKKLDMTFSG